MFLHIPLSANLVSDKERPLCTNDIKKLPLNVRVMNWIKCLIFQFYLYV